MLAICLFEYDLLIRVYECDLLIRVYECDLLIRVYECDLRIRVYEYDLLIRVYDLLICALDGNADMVSLDAHTCSKFCIMFYIHFYSFLTPLRMFATHTYVHVQMSVCMHEAEAQFSSTRSCEAISDVTNSE